jgi:uncharacterized Tic20 family protein
MKKSKSIIILSIALLLLGISLFMIGGVIAGWDVLGWFGTPMALLIYFAVLIFAMILLLAWYKMRDY